MADQKLNIIIDAQNKADKALKDVNSQLGKTTKNFEGLTKVLKVGALAMGAFAVVVGKKMYDATIQFDKAMGNLKTLIGENTEQVDKFEKGIKNLLKTIPKSADDLGASAYAVVSAGISDADEALKVLESSAKLAVAGLGETAEATDIMTSAINAFGIDANKSNKVADTFFKAVKNGKTTVAELAQGFGQVAPLANQLGIEFEDLLSSTSAMTTSGLKASVAYTQIRAVMSNMLKPTAEMAETMALMGINSDNLSENLSQTGLTGILQQMKTTADENGISLAKMFGSVEGLNAVLMLTGETGQLANDIFADMTGGVDALTSAFETQKNTLDANVQLLKNNLSVVLVNLGEKIIPVLNKAIEGIIYIINNWNSILQTAVEWFRNIINLINEKTGLIDTLRFAWSMIYQTLQDDIIPVFQNIWQILEPFMPYLKILAQIIGFVLLQALKLVIVQLSLLFSALGKVLHFISEVALAITNFFKPALDAMIDGIQTLVGWLKQAWEWLKKVSEKMSLGGIGTGLKNIAGGISSAIGTVGGALTPFAEGGIVTRPTRALIGEAGAEAVVPLKKSGMFGTTVNINGGTYLSEDVAEQMGDMIIKKLRFDYPIG